MQSKTIGKFNHFRIFLSAIMLFSMLAITPTTKASAAGEIICYVQWNLLTGNNDGSSWANAYRGGYIALQYALQNDSTCTQIWVAEGYYYPTDGSDRTTTFELKNGVAIYGGFAGTETSLSQRDPLTHQTYLMGNINDLSIQTDNVFHVVTASNTDSTAVLDGFTITAGYADGPPGDPSNSGGGMYIKSGSPTLSNLKIEYNTALQSGGGIHMQSSSDPTMTNITFEGNTVINGDGGGMSASSYSDPTLTDVTFINNSAGNSGGGLKAHLSNPILTNMKFESNTATRGGGIYSYSDMIINNAVFSANEATNGKAGGWYIFRGDPVLTNATFYLNNATTEGGGMYIEAETTAPTLTNVTFYGNHADNKGGAIYSWQSAAILAHITFQDNSALVNGGAISHVSTIAGVQPTILNSILWGNSTEIFNEGASQVIVEDSVVAGGYSGGTGIITANPYLGFLGDNGGFSETIPISASGSAFNSANDTYCPTSDQRGVTRPQGVHCDIGAYEKEYFTMVLKSIGKHDGWVLESGEFSGKGGSKNNRGKVLMLGDDAQDKQYRAILSFNTATLPENAVITKVILKVRKAGMAGTNPMQTHNGLVVDIKQNKFSTRPALQVKDFQATANMNKIGKFSKKLYSGWYKSVLNTIGRDNINKIGHTQFRLRFLRDDNDDYGADILKLYSGNAGKSSRPQLIVEYYEQ